MLRWNRVDIHIPVKAFVFGAGSSNLKKRNPIDTQGKHIFT